MVNSSRFTFGYCPPHFSFIYYLLNKMLQIGIGEVVLRHNFIPYLLALVVQLVKLLNAPQPLEEIDQNEEHLYYERRKRN